MFWGQVFRVKDEKVYDFWPGVWGFGVWVPTVRYRALDLGPDEWGSESVQ